MARRRRQRALIGLLAVLSLCLTPLAPAPLPAQADQPKARSQPMHTLEVPAKSYAAMPYRWTQVNRDEEDKSYWNTLRGRAFVGYAEFGEDKGAMFRSFFQLDTGPLIGSTISSAKFQIVLDETGVKEKEPVDLWQTESIDPSKSLTWNNSKNKWIKKLASAKGSADPASQPDMAMEFNAQSILDLVRTAAAGRKSFVTVGLRAPDEDEGDQWKVFYWDTAKIVVSYNNPPRVPIKVNFNRPQPCGTATAPAAINTTQPTLGAVASDLDNDNVTTRLTIRRTDTNAVVHEVDSALTTSGAAFAWPQIPADKLTEGVIYSYQARSDDAVADDGIPFGPTSPACYFTVDQTPPPPPTIESTDYPESVAVIPARTAGVVTLRPAAGDTDTTEFYYGFQQDRVTQRIPVGPDGTAKLPVTITPNPPNGAGDARLFVRSADRAGQLSAVTPGWSLRAKPNPSPPPQVRGDVNGDGRADVQAVLDHGNGRTSVWNLVAGGNGLLGGQIGWDSGDSGGYPLDRTRSVPGDFDGDGRSDVALFREEAGRRMSLRLLESDGNGYVAAASPSWVSGPDSWTHSMARIASGDVDGDHRSDLAVQVNNGDGTWKVLVFRGGALGAPTEWLRATGDWALSSLQLADLNGDGSDDLVTQKTTANCRTVSELYRSTGTAFAATPVVLHDSGAGAYCLDRSRTTVGDVDGDGRDDLIAAYDYSDTDLGVVVFRSTGTPSQPTLTSSVWWRTPGEFDPAKVALSAGDFTGDGKDDLAILASTANGGRAAYLLNSSGTAFGPRRLAWQGTTVGAVTGPKFELENRAYELVARHSRRCLQVKGAGQDNETPFEQAACAGALQQRFRVEQVAGTDQFMLHPNHIDGAGIDGRSRCLDVNDESLADDAPIVQWACFGNAYQQFGIEPVDGVTGDTLVRLRMGHSGKCVGVRGAATTDGAVIAQQTCSAAASQQWILRPAAAGKQLDARYRISSVRGGKVVDVTNCVNADGADMRTWTWNSGSPCQRWRLKPVGDDVYQLIDPSSGKAADVLGCSEENVAIVHLWTADDSACQRWRIEPANGGSWSIRQTTTGKSMDVGGCREDAGADLIIWPYWNGPCQRWKLDKYDG
ncbi:RICIN domain-containing protein [Kribbella sp. NBC_01505]|uniref:RICIN domain-containing protein n=1 Tax=Kribbella sp. NBC_01505 TaxID=2903580 RepID=UPI003868A92E